jgi:hypothetical protein
MSARLVSPVLLVLAAVAAPALAQTPLMKCWEADGRVLYSDRGCDAAAATRELRVSPWGSEPAPARKHVVLRSAQTASGAAPAPAGASGTAATAGAGRAAAAATVPADRRPVGSARAAASTEDQAERERLQAQRDGYRRDVNRTRDLRSKLAPLGY